MRRALPISWIILSGFGLIGSIISYLPLIRVGQSKVLLATLPVILPAALFTLALAAAYLLMIRTVNNKTSVWLGWGHVGAHLISGISAHGLSYLRNDVIAKGDKIDPSAFMTLAIVSMVFGIIATLCFFAAMLSAALSAKRSIDLANFD